MTTAIQTRAIHYLRRQIAGFDDDAYRDHLRARFSVVSSTALSDWQANVLIGDLRKLAGQAGGRTAANTASGPFRAILQALWISGWNLGLIASPDDRAMIKFVERQTGLTHTRFLTDPKDALRAIEALKGWLERAGVAWPKGRNPLARKRAVIDAQEAIIRLTLPAFDALTFGVLAGLPHDFAAYGDKQFDRLSEKMGRLVRERTQQESCT